PRAIELQKHPATDLVFLSCDRGAGLHYTNFYYSRHIMTRGRGNWMKLRMLYYSVGAALFIVAFASPFIFETNDDSKMMMLVSGTFSGVPEDYGVFIHPLLSLFFSQ